MLASSKLQTIIWTSRLDEAEQFYGGVLGLSFKGKSQGALVYDVSGGELRVSPGHVIAAFSARGIKCERFPGFPHDEAGVLVTPDGARVAWFRDPDGNLLSVVQFP